MDDRSNPVDDIQTLLSRLAIQLESAARSWEGELDNRSRLDFSGGGGATSLDLADRDDAFAVTVDVPGYESDDLEIRLHGATLSIRGERERERGHDSDQYIRRERSIQSFSRQLQLPEPVDADAVDASVNNGILTVELPKAAMDEGATAIDID
ncbi:Hsp20/alpha crystallin family protein [Salinadaptatus halalkaliphilus]|uniref:Hsp20/alpha crystallin family protein n=1 Tax=Salinadaptatus halalkaliphilus TaxID=2419781 RepID=A0A4S3TQ76_9EURY|nr:Hsp20/alpha crystallin family protein [Salinadaptatus halalkaliphilus]THE66532.1 Hsp20/alpha crystallin family protein [Salinadaptatus halalkaliphilus]